VSNINKAIIVGNLGDDPETKYTQGGMAVTSMRVATTSRRKKNGERVEKTAWHRVKAFGKLAEICGEYLRKGSKVYIEGEIDYSESEKDGVKRYFTEILANEMRMLDGKREDGGTRAPRANQAPARNAQQPAKTVNEKMDEDFADDDIPF